MHCVCYVPPLAPFPPLLLSPLAPCLPLQVVVVLTIAKMSSMHKVRIFGINKD